MKNAVSGLGLAPDAAIALGGFIAGKSLVQLGSDGEKPLSEVSGSQKGRSAKKSKKAATLSFSCHYAPSCQRTFKTQNAANGHARSCEFRPTISMPIDVSKKETVK